MISTQIETFLENACFTALFLLMIIYWVQASFQFTKNFTKIGLVSTVFVNFLLLLVLVVRWFNYGHFPLSNLYESLLFLSWSLTLFQFILEKSSKNIFLGAVISPMALFTTGFASFSLPKEMQKASVLVPALQSNWLMMHVTIMMLSYAALICGSLLAITFLIVTNRVCSPLVTIFDDRELSSLSSTFTGAFAFTQAKVKVGGKRNAAFNGSKERGKRNPLLVNFQSEQILDSADSSTIFDDMMDIHKSNTLLNEENVQTLSDEEYLFQENKLAETIDNLSYRMLGIGFPLLTIGILSGSVWANEAWGSYWSWDPKETWAFITWLVFAIYLHTRITKGWQGKKPAIIASVGFLIVWVCYLGVNLIGKGLHSYGWIK